MHAALKLRSTHNFRGRRMRDTHTHQRWCWSIMCLPMIYSDLRKRCTGESTTLIIWQSGGRERVPLNNKQNSDSGVRRKIYSIVACSNSIISSDSDEFHCHFSTEHKINQLKKPQTQLLPLQLHHRQSKFRATVQMPKSKCAKIRI